MLKGKVMTILLINELIKKISLYKITKKTKRKVQLDLSNYATKSDLEMQHMLIHGNSLQTLHCRKK